MLELVTPLKYVSDFKGHCVPKQPIRAVQKLKYSRIRIKCFVLFVYSKRDSL